MTHHTVVELTDRNHKFVKIAILIHLIIFIIFYRDFLPLSDLEK